MSKRVIVSDVNGLKEMVIDQINGVYFKIDNKEAFIKAIESVLENDNPGQSACDWVVDYRDWEVLMKKLVQLYDNLNVKVS